MELRELIAREVSDLVRMRRELHRRPELSDCETGTSRFISDELTRLGIEWKGGFGRAGTGVVGFLGGRGAGKGSGKGPTFAQGGENRGTGGGTGGGTGVALRADIDALPIQEATGKPYASLSPGVMHACGHDGHTTILLGAARVLAGLGAGGRPNPVTFLFQPAEEHLGGAEVMCEQGALRGAAGGGVGVAAGRVYGLHGWPSLEVGTVGTRAGPLLAATDEFEVKIVGQGGHAAYPHLCKDPIVAAAAVVGALQSLSSRAVSPVDSLVCTVGVLRGGSASNIIPDFAELSGTVRTLRAETRALARRRVFEIVEGTAAAHGCRAEISWREGYPVTENDPGEAERVLAVAAEVCAGFGGKAVRTETPTMGGEDFAYFGQHLPACFFFLGLRPRGAGAYPALHQPVFDFNDDALPVGVEMMCRLAVSE